MLTIVDGFWDTVRRRGDTVAVRDSSACLTYRQLGEQVLRVAAELGRSLGRAGPVAVFTPQDVSSAVALIGALASGRGVIPLDTDHPDARNRLIAGHADAAGVATTSASAARARGLFESGAAVIEVDRLEDAPGYPPPPPGPDDLALVIYTSGSTGAPKGAFQTHGRLLAEIVHSVEGFGLQPADQSAVFYPPAVMAGWRSLLGNLLAGSTAHLLTPRTLGAQGLVRDIRERGITIFRGSATLFRHVADAASEGDLASLRLVALGGDRVDWADYDTFRRVCPPQARFASHLGATECGIYAEWIVEEAARGKGGGLPVGRANPGYRVMLQDEAGAEVPEGEVGEFVIEGARVAAGYWRDPERTAAAFGPGSAEGLRTYRTGDLGRRRQDGLYEVAGRRDHQIKLRGFRVELGEIESALRACSGIKDGAVVTRRSASGAVRSLAAYVERKPGADSLQARHVTSMLAQRLPAHMLPADIVIVDALPWLANFKIDRQRLEAMDAERTAPAAAAPDRATAAIVQAFEKVLRHTGIQPEDDLLSLGGDSLQAVDIALEIELALGVRVSPEAIDIACPIGELAARLGLSRPAAGRAASVA